MVRWTKLKDTGDIAKLSVSTSCIIFCMPGAASPDSLSAEACWDIETQSVDVLDMNQLENILVLDVHMSCIGEIMGNQDNNMILMILMILGIWAKPCSNVFFVGPVSSFDQSHSDSLIMFSQWTQASETSSDLKINTSMQNPCMSMYRPWQWHDRTLNTQNTQTGQAGSTFHVWKARRHTELAQNLRLSPLPGCLP